MMRSARQVVARALLRHQLWPLGGLRLSSSSSSTPAATFAALGIHPSLVERLPPGVRAPTPDQAEAARVLLSGGSDGDGGDGSVVALAGATGTGKTLAYLLPLLTRWLRGAESSSNGGAVLVVSPSQELAAQVARVGKGLLLSRGDGGGPDLLTTTPTTTGSVQLLIGGASIARQRAALAELGADRRGACTPDETEAERAARLRRQQAGRRLARERRRGDKAPAAPLALVAGTPARLARLLEEGSLDGRVFGSLVLEEADQLSAGSSGDGGGQAEGGGSNGSDDDDDADNNPFREKKGYADALGVICAAVPEEARARAVLVSATLRRRPSALAALLPLLKREEGAQAQAPPVFVPSSSSSSASPALSPTQQVQSQAPMKPKHVIVLAPPQHRAAAARAALRALGARAALVFAAERGGRLDDAAAKLKGLVGEAEGGGVWVLHGGMTPSGRKAALGAFARAVSAGAAAAVGGVEKRRGPGRPRKKKVTEDDDDDNHYRAPLPLFADDAQEEEDASSSALRPRAPPPPAVLVASDLAARGLDLPGLDAVVSLDPPRTAAAYAHRAGRVGRLNGGAKTGPAFVVTVATAGAQAAAVRRLCASLGVALVEAPSR